MTNTIPSTSTYRFTTPYRCGNPSVLDFKLN